jgi:formate dehydrogenase major subunit
MVKVTIDHSVHDARGNERLIDLLNRIGTELAQVCHHPQFGPVQTCDACLVETNDQLVRACGTDVSDGMEVSTKSAKAFEAQRQAFDRILRNHVLYCTVCDMNNGNCTVHRTESLLAIEHQAIPYLPSLMKRIIRIPSIVMIRIREDIWRISRERYRQTRTQAFIISMATARSMG